MDPYHNYPTDFSQYETFLNILSKTDSLTLYQQFYRPLQDSRKTIKELSKKLDRANYQLAHVSTDIYISPEKFVWKMNLQANFRRRFLYWLPREITQKINNILAQDLYSEFYNWQQYIIYLKQTHQYSYGQLRFSQFWEASKPFQNNPILLRSHPEEITLQSWFSTCYYYGFVNHMICQQAPEFLGTKVKFLINSFINKNYPILPFLKKPLLKISVFSSHPKYFNHEYQPASHNLILSYFEEFDSQKFLYYPFPCLKIPQNFDNPQIINQFPFDITIPLELLGETSTTKIWVLKNMHLLHPYLQKNLAVPSEGSSEDSEDED